MSLSEFDIIDKYFTGIGSDRSDIRYGVGDDCAVLRPGSSDLAVTTDALIAGVHFDDSTPVNMLGYKSVAVSLSDLAAMGATPAWMTLALTLPQADTEWLDLFSTGVRNCCNEFNLTLVGGNISHGPLSICTQLIGKLVDGQCLTRSQAQPGDNIYVTGNIGEAGLGLLIQQQKLIWPDAIEDDTEYLKSRLNKPTPRTFIGQGLLPFASACIDISDGLAADLGHLTRASGVGAQLSVDNMPIHSIYKKFAKLVGGWQQAITAGEDYELCFTASPEHSNEIIAISQKTKVKISHIGEVESEPGIRCELKGEFVKLEKSSYQHF